MTGAAHPVSEVALEDGVPRRRPRSWRYGLLVTAMTLMVAVLAYAVLSMFLELRRLRDSEAAAGEALAVARSYAADLLSYDHRTVEEDLARARRHTTGDLAERYRRLQETLAPRARQQRAVQQAVVSGAAVESSAPDRVRIVMFLDTETARTGGDEEGRRQVTQNRVRMTMVRTERGWLVEDLSTLLGTAPAV